MVHIRVECEQCKTEETGEERLVHEVEAGSEQHAWWVSIIEAEEELGHGDQ